MYQSIAWLDGFSLLPIHFAGVDLLDHPVANWVSHVAGNFPDDHDVDGSVKDRAGRNEDYVQAGDD